MSKLTNALLVIGICFITVFMTILFLLFFFIGKYLEQYNEWEDA